MPLTISVITPSFNQAEFLPRTIASVKAQTAAAIEHIILDPGSADGSREIAAAENTVTLIAEPDNGQADAVARGMLAAKGDIIAWLNSDDEYYDETVFQTVIDAFQSEDRPDIVYGAAIYIGKDGEKLRDAHVINNPDDLAARLPREVGIVQPATFIARSLIERIGPPDRDLHFCMDYEFWIRASKSGAKFLHLDKPLAKARYYAENKTASLRGDSYAEVIKMLKKHYGFAHLNWLRRLADFRLHDNDGVLKSYGNEPHDQQALDHKTHDLNFRVNGDFATISRLKSAGIARIAGQTVGAGNSGRQHHAAVYARPIDENEKRSRAEKFYTVGPQKWAFDAKWLECELGRSDSIFERLSQSRASDACILVGNGPSLKKTNLDDFGGADCFISNYAFLDRKLLALSKYLCVTNYLVAEQEPESFNLLDCVIKFAPYWLSYCMLATPDMCYVRSVGHAEFSGDFRKNISWRSTVSFFSMQLAFALGYRKLLLVGFDHSYKQPASKEGDIIHQSEDDENHFDKKYFKGKKWQAADTGNMEAMYRLAKRAYARDGREIVNCTVGGRLELFRRGDLAEEISKHPRRPLWRLRQAAAPAAVPAEIDQITRDSLIDVLPAELRHEIFLPTSKISAEAQLIGLRKTKELYVRELGALYRRRLRALKAARGRDRCFIIGNGPSLNKTDLGKLTDEDVFATNGFFLKMPELDWTPAYYVVEDHLVAEDRAGDINALRGPVKLFPANLRYVIEPDADTIFFDHRPRRSFPHGFDFSFDADQETFSGGTVTYTCLQLAAYLGYREIYLIGVDADYSVPADATLTGAGRVKHIDMQSDDANHFHPDYFGKGKRWHEPNVDVMMQAYAEAQRACSERGLEIFNATIGGKLEIFPRVAYEDLFKPTAAPIVFAAPDLNSSSAPRLLLIDHTLIGDGTATGEIKANLLAGWPADRLLQFASGHKGALVKKDAAQTVSIAGGWESAVASAWAAIARLAPEVILYRPVPDTPVLHALAMEIIAGSGLPYAVWIMDDWPAALEMRDAEQYAMLDADWRKLITGAARRFAISEEMADAFEKRYCAPFTPVANGVDSVDWPEPVKSESNRFVIRYAGSLAENMTLSTIALVAEAVEHLAGNGADIAFEIKTRPIWKRRAADLFGRFKHTSFFTDDLSAADYRTWLQRADATVIGYNFDPESLDYIKYSVANKLPECLASGAPLIAVGPPDTSTIRRLAEIDCAICITEPNMAQIAAALADLMANPERRSEIGARARVVAFEKFNLPERRAILEKALNDIAAPNVLTPLPRTAKARVDETGVVARLLALRKGGAHVMFDIGAHVGSSAAYFHQLGWTIFCFEPDPENRRKLTAAFRGKEGVSIDPRAVSDKTASEVSFFSSPESTGISGLSAFRDTHAESARVDVTTIAEIAKERGVTGVDFLKIDVEGFDFSVLRGVPWDRLKPDVIECEFEDAKTIPLGHGWRDMAQFLQDKGYAVYVSEWHPIVRYGIAHDWRRVFRFGDDDIATDAWGNLLAFRDDPGLAAINGAFRDCLKFPQAASKAAGHPAGIQHRNGASDKDPKTMPAPVVKATAAPGEIGGYAALAHTLRDRSPRAFALARFIKRILRQVWARRLWTLPALFVAVGAYALTLLPIFEGKRFEAAGVISLFFIAASILYLAFRMFSLAERLLAENATLRLQIEGQTAQSARALATVKRQFDAQSVTLSKSFAVADQRHRADQRRTADLAEAARLNAHRLALAIRDANEAINQAKERIENTDALLYDARTKIKGLRNADEKLAEADERAIRQIEAAKGLAGKSLELAKSAPPNNALLYQRFNRKLSAEHIDMFSREWAPKIGTEFPPATLGYLASRACHVEAMSEGRLATSIENILLRTLVCFDIHRPELDILEIGTLFGIGAVIMHDALAPHFKRVRLSLLDPLDGYYASEKKDILTGQPVNEAVLKRNLQRARVNDENVTIIKRLSTDADAMKAAAERAYDVLVIDGDHSYDGVKFDFDHYAPLVRPGGLIVIDDYHSPDWPDVTRFVDEELSKRKGFSLFGASWRTCVYKADS